MVVGIVKLSLHIPETRSLKGKRQVVKKILQRVNGRFKNVAISEVGEHDLWQKAEIGFSTVGVDQRVINRVLDQVLDYIEGFDEIEVIQADMEIFSM